MYSESLGGVLAGLRTDQRLSGDRLSDGDRLDRPYEQVCGNEPIDDVNRRAECDVVEPVARHVSQTDDGRAQPVAVVAAGVEHTGHGIRNSFRIGADLREVDHPVLQLGRGLRDQSRIDQRLTEGIDAVVTRRAEQQVQISVDQVVAAASHRVAQPHVGLIALDHAARTAAADVGGLDDPVAASQRDDHRAAVGDHIRGGQR